MKLRATIVIDFDPNTFQEAAEDEKFIHAHMEQIKEKYPSMDVQIKERRERETKVPTRRKKAGTAA